MGEGIKFPHSKLYIFLNFFTITATIVIFYILYVTSPDALQSYEAPKSLECAIIVFRHGSRSPILTFPRDTSVWVEGLRQITSKGKVQMFKRGQILRQRYKHFFNYSFHQEDFLIRTTNSSRTRLSLEILLTGMFPADENSKWQPVQIWTDNFDKTAITVDASEKCPKYGSEHQAALEFDSYLQNNTEFIEYLFKHTRLQVKDPLDMLVIWDVLNCLEDNGNPIPNWATNWVIQRLNEEGRIIINSFVAYSPQGTKFLEGPLINYFEDWLTRKFYSEHLLTKKLDKNSTEKILMHSGHDYTLLSLLSMVGYKDLQLINPASVLIFEVHKARKSHVVKLMLYNSTNFENEELVEPINLNMPRCNNECSLESFLSLLREYGLDEDTWDEECWDVKYKDLQMEY